MVPLLMAFLSLTLKDLVDWIHLIIYYFANLIAQPSAYQLLIVGSTITVTTLIFFYAWKWPKQEV